MIKCSKALGEIIERRKRYFTSDEMETVSVAHGKLIALEEMEEQGRLVRLPCKIGDKVRDKIADYVFTVEQIELGHKVGTLFRCGNPGTDDYMAFYDFEIGEKIEILTHEEAALKGEKTNEIKVGDEIATDCGDTFIVTQVAGNCLFGIDKDGKPHNVILPHARKTGRYFAQIAETLKQAKGENNA